MSRFNDSLTLNYLNRVVLWKEMYYFSISLFLFSIVIFPFFRKLSVFSIFVIIGLWSKIPGFIHFSLNKMMITDLLTFVIAIYQGFFPALLYVIITSLLGVFMGPKVWPFYVAREGIGLTVSALVISLFDSLKADAVKGFYVFLIIHYVTYYLLVFFLTPDEIYLEIMLLPAVIFFDFIWTAKGFGVFKLGINGLMVGESSGVILILGIGGILLFGYIVKKLVFGREIMTATPA